MVSGCSYALRKQLQAAACIATSWRLSARLPLIPYCEVRVLGTVEDATWSIARDFALRPRDGYSFDYGLC